MYKNVNFWQILPTENNTYKDSYRHKRVRRIWKISKVPVENYFFLNGYDELVYEELFDCENAEEMRYWMFQRVVVRVSSNFFSNL